MGRKFSPAVWATAFATLIAFMGIGVVDPILSSILKAMHASAFAVEWLFTSYIAVMALAMLLSGVLSTKFGARRVLIVGLSLVVIFAGLCALAPNIGVLAVFRGGWGLGNAFFTSTALSIIVGASSGGMAAAITLYEAALGLGMASGPLLGGFLGSIHWRMPFAGTSTLMLIALILTLTLVRDTGHKEAPRTAADLFRAMKHPGVISNALIGLTYSFAFFTILAYSPITMTSVSALGLGFVFFAWGVLVGISSVFVVNWLRPLMGPVRMLDLNLLCMVAVLVAAALVNQRWLVIVIIVSGFFCGISNALFTTLAMEVSPFSRSISSGTYNFLRWSGAAVAPVLDGLLKDAYGVQVPFWVAAAVMFLGWLGLKWRAGVLDRCLAEQGHAEGHGHGSGHAFQVNRT
ncbi:MFS transporter [Alicyclobacillus macrosporangiidus]|uniref:Predicted arabinose efflux permease, MFS family n=1 Tax=Alicyclobacillus macrosporangiidus TaxID=392015 RepID=A0A1I7KS17_9BACL|nr:MFS transporter [Alicyclobacillus macrosporangiidus]SFV00243.1 Predicted arabinose efflux permease, MFS family [Alicyclobacillus macrosporangiidus]